MRAAARFLGFALISLALLAGLLSASVTLWLQTASGRDWVGRVLVREATGRLALTLTVGRVTGSMVRGIRLEDVALHDAQGRLVARAGALSARYRLRRLVRRHEVDELAVVRPEIERLPSAAAPAARPHRKPTRFSVHNLTITDGSFGWRGHDVRHLSANAAIDSGAHGQRFEGEVRGVLDEQPLLVRARVERDGGRMEVSAELHGAAFDVRGYGDCADGQLTASLESLDLDPELLASARPFAGRGALHARGTVVGPLDALDVELQGHTDDRGLALGALVDVPRRTARLAAFVAAPTRSAGLRARAALHGRALDVTALQAHTGATRLAGAAHIGASRLDAALDARVVPDEAVVVGIHPAAAMRLRVALHGPPRALDVRVHGRLRAARVALAGRVDLRARRGRARFVAEDVRPSEIERAAPPDLAFSGAFTFDGAIGHAGLAGTMSVTDGSLRALGQRFERLKGAGHVRLGQPGEAQVETLTGQLAASRPRPIEVQTLIRWDRQALQFDAQRVVLDENRATGSVVYTQDPVTRQPRIAIRAQRMSLSPSLVEEFLHRRPSKAWPGNASFVWTRGGSALEFALATEEGPVKGVARLRRDHASVEVTSIDLAVGGSRVHGAARVKNGEIAASLDGLLLEPSLVHRLLPALEPGRTIRIQGAAAGPLHALDVHLLASAGASSAMLRGRVDLRARSFRLVATLDTFYLQSIKQTSTSRINLELSLSGRLVDGGIAGKLTVRHAWGTIEGLPLDAARLDATLSGPRFKVDQMLIGVPGAVVEGNGGGTYRDFKVGYGVVITDALELKKVPEYLRLTVGLTTLTPGRSVVGSIRRHHGGKIENVHHTIPPPFRFLSMLYRLLSGHRLHLSVQ
jgi:hypothetical protein